jgi:hypothetical protein
MKIDEVVITEKPVISSWISDLTLVRGRSGNVTMTLGNGRKYSVKKVGSKLYNQWLNASSKGMFWHQNIKKNYVVVRLL